LKDKTTEENQSSITKQIIDKLPGFDLPPVRAPTIDFDLEN